MAGSGAGRGSAWWCPRRDLGWRLRAVVLRRVTPGYPSESCGGRVMLWLAARVSPMATDPASTVAWSCLVVIGGPVCLSLPAAHGGGLLRGWGWWRTTHRRVYGRWRPPLLPMRSTGGRRHWGLPICLIKVAGIGFLLCEDGDFPDAGPS
jgi:hypothetical protein